MQEIVQHKLLQSWLDYSSSKIQNDFYYLGTVNQRKLNTGSFVRNSIIADLNSEGDFV
jgi:hypothetical protein